MLSFNINLTSLAVILWSGMLVISGSIWVLSSQVRKLADLLEEQNRASAAEPVPGAVSRSSASSARIARRGSQVRVRGVVRTAVAISRNTPQLLAPRQEASTLLRTSAAERTDHALRS